MNSMNWYNLFECCFFFALEIPQWLKKYVDAPIGSELDCEIEVSRARGVGVS